MRGKISKDAKRPILENPKYQKIVDSLGEMAESRHRFMRTAMAMSAMDGSLMLPCFAQGGVPEIAYPLVIKGPGSKSCSRGKYIDPGLHNSHPLTS